MYCLTMARQCDTATTNGGLRLPIASIGPIAYDVLAAGPVMSFTVFERSIYVESATGGIACVGDHAIGDGPLNALLAPDFPIINYTPGRMIEADLSHSTRWAPPIDVTPPPPSKIRYGLKALGSALPAHGLADGLSLLLDPLLRGATTLDTAVPLHRAATPGIQALSEWLATPAAAPKDSVLSLIGLGPGLTPSGDDLLGSCLVALQRVGRQHDSDRLADAVLASAQTATGRISLAHLECAARGLGAAPLHNTLEAILAGDNIGNSLIALDRVGHSSGWDALVGVILVLRGV